MNRNVLGIKNDIKYMMKNIKPRIHVYYKYIIFSNNLFKRKKSNINNNNKLIKL